MGIPWDILTTDRCLVRETGQRTLDALYEIYAEPSVTQYTEGLYPSGRKEEALFERIIRKICIIFYNYGVWTICDRMTGQVIGRAGFSNREGYEDPELGFVIGVPWQRQGICYGSMQGIIKIRERRIGI